MSILSRLLIIAVLAAASPTFAQTKAEPPVPVRTVNPVYPADLKREGITGVVTIKCLVDEKGNVTDPQVVKSSHEGFEKPALDALAKWKFKPGRQDGNPVGMKVSIPIRFAIEG